MTADKTELKCKQVDLRIDQLNVSGLRMIRDVDLFFY